MHLSNPSDPFSVQILCEASDSEILKLDDKTFNHLADQFYCHLKNRLHQLQKSSSTTNTFSKDNS